MCLAARKVLVVDDDCVLRRLVRGAFGEPYEVREASDGLPALEIVDSWQPDIVLLDIMMPGMNGVEVCRLLKTRFADQAPLVMMVSGKAAQREKMLAFAAGADDYLVKPLDNAELVSRVELHFRLRAAEAIVAASRQELDMQHNELKRLAAERVQQMIAIQDIAIFTLAKVAELRDNETGEHLVRMREYSQILARQLKAKGHFAEQLDDQFLEDLYRSSPLHDIGKVGIPDNILLKPGKLTVDEFEVMKRHTAIGASILREAVMQSSSGSFLAMAADIAESHHERIDGAGYPKGLFGHEIPLPARIVAVADVYDALTSKRRYKRAWTSDRARRHMQQMTGTQFDPLVIEVFLASLPEFLEVQSAYADREPAVFSSNKFGVQDVVPAQVSSLLLDITTQHVLT